MPYIERIKVNIENRISHVHAIVQLSTNHRTMYDLKATCHPLRKTGCKITLLEQDEDDD